MCSGVEPHSLADPTGPQLLVGEDKVKDEMPNALQDVRTKVVNLSALHYGAVSTAGASYGAASVCVHM